MDSKNVLHIDSIFRFKGGCSQLFIFLKNCSDCDCTVIFDNEGLTVTPNSNPETNMILVMYASIAENPKVAIEYHNYMDKVKSGTILDKVTW